MLVTFESPLSSILPCQIYSLYNLIINPSEDAGRLDQMCWGCQEIKQEVLPGGTKAYQERPGCVLVDAKLVWHSLCRPVYRPVSRKKKIIKPDWCMQTSNMCDEALYNPLQLTFTSFLSKKYPGHKERTQGSSLSSNFHGIISLWQHCCFVWASHRLQMGPNWDLSKALKNQYRLL